MSISTSFVARAPWWFWLLVALGLGLIYGRELIEGCRQVCPLPLCEHVCRTNRQNGASQYPKSALNANRIANGEWVEGELPTASLEDALERVVKFDAGTGVAHNLKSWQLPTARLRALFNVSERPVPVPLRHSVEQVGIKKALFLHGRQVWPHRFDQMRLLPEHYNYSGREIVVAAVKDSGKATVVVDGKIWNSWFDDVGGFIVSRLGRVIAVVRIGTRVTIAVDGSLWSNSFEHVMAFRASHVDPNLIAAIVKQGTQWTVAVNGKLWPVWFPGASLVNGAEVAVMLTRRGSVVALDPAKTFVAIDGKVVQVPWGKVQAISISHAGNLVVEVQGQGFSTLLSERGLWSSRHEQMRMFAAGPGTASSALVNVNGKWTYAVNGQPLMERFDDAYLWALKSDGSMLAAVVADKQADGKFKYRVIVRNLN